MWALDLFSADDSAHIHWDLHFRYDGRIGRILGGEQVLSPIGRC